MQDTSRTLAYSAIQIAKAVPAQPIETVPNVTTGSTNKATYAKLVVRNAINAKILQHTVYCAQSIKDPSRISVEKTSNLVLLKNTFL